MSHSRRNGLARADVLAVCSCAAIAAVIGSVAFAQAERAQPTQHVKSIRDATHINQLHKAMIIYANENKGILPMPGAIDRKPDKELGEVPGKGEIDWDANTTANLFSLLIAQNYFTPELPISPVERNPKVTLDQDYDYGAYNPVQDSYWDAKFTADLKTGSNVSYAHQPIVKDTVAKVWSNSMLPDLAQIGNRGPRDGALDPGSITCDPHGNWAGNIVFGDNHTEFLHATARQGDNLFKADEREIDSLLAFTKLMKDGKPELQFD